MSNWRFIWLMVLTIQMIIAGVSEVRHEKRIADLEQALFALAKGGTER